MRVTVAEPDYAERLCGYLCSVGFPAVKSGRGEIEVLLAHEDADVREEASAALQPFLRVWQGLYPDVRVGIETRV